MDMGGSGALKLNNVVCYLLIEKGVVMKVFQVSTEYSKDDSNEIVEQVQYVTHDSDSLLKVTEHFTQHCEEFGMELKCVREVLTVCQHITNKT